MVKTIVKILVIALIWNGVIALCLQDSGYVLENTYMQTIQITDQE